MSFLKELQSVKLKQSSEPTRDFSSPKTAGFLHQSDIDSYQSSVLDVNTEEWLHLLKDHTFPSTYVPISVDEARVFKDVYDRLYKNLDPGSISQLLWEDNLTPEEIAVIDAVRVRLQLVIDKFIVKPEQDYVFVKLSSRSPKDAPMAQRRFKSIYKKHLMEESKSERTKENTQVTCLLKAAFEALKVSSASEVLDACLRSERTYQDLLLALDVPDRFRENFVVRQFVHIDVDMEFRAFVHDRRMTAISQYNYLIHSKRLSSNQDHYRQLITKFFAKEIAPKLETFVADYIIDFAVCDEGSKLWVIELNPFLVTTDSALFSWEHERSLLEGENTEDGVDVHFRVVERPRPGATKMLPVGMKDLLKSALEHQ